MSQANQKISYAQSGEDLIVKFIFDSLRIFQPSYIDIGAYHPEIYSNTSLFYQNGSRGINIEANPDLINDFCERRSKDINLNIGISETSGEMDFYIMSTRTLSTFSKAEAELYSKDNNYKIEKIVSIEVFTVNQIIESYLDGQFPDFLSLDVEGKDLQILESIDYSKSAPLVICVETISFSDVICEGVKNLSIVEFLESQGYVMYADTYINSIFIKKDIWKNQEIANRNIGVQNKILTNAINDLTDQLDRANQEIETIKDSKFWKLRNAWMKLKKKLKLESNDFDNVSVDSDYFGMPDSEASNNPTPIQIGTINEQPRNQWIEQQLREISEGLRILDAGCGEQQHRKFCHHLNYVSQDFDNYHGQGDFKGLQTGDWDQSNIDIISDIASIPEPDHSFDIILCAEVFEHLPDPLAALKEFERLLVSGGKLILTAPFCSLTHFSPHHFYSGFNRYFYEANLQKYGFEILKIETNGNFFEYIAQELRRVNYVAKRYANYDFSELDHNTIYQSLSLLELINQSQNDSEDLLCFGYHVLAKKKKY